MPCASTGCARLKNAVRFLRRSTIKGSWPERRVLAAPVESIDEDELLAELGGAAGSSDITELRHVRTSADKRAAEEIANRQKCEDFDHFKPLFLQIQKEIESGIRQTRPFELKAEIRPGSWFIVGGQKAYVAEMGEIFSNAQGRTDARLRVIFDNGTESNLLMRSLQRALHKDEAGRRITDPVAGPLFASENAGPPFASENADCDQASGTIYVLRSKSDHPVVAANRDVLHKIGVTGGDVARRIANAKFDPTFLMADVEIVATYELYNINRTKLENLVHPRHGTQGASLGSMPCVARMSEATSGSPASRHSASKTRVNALLAHAGYRSSRARRRKRASDRGATNTAARSRASRAPVVCAALAAAGAAMSR